MKHLVILLFFLICFFELTSAQRNVDIGILIGAASYQGEVNPARPFYSPSPSFGGFFRMNINNRYAVRLSGYYARLKGDINDFPDRNYVGIQQNEFNTRVLDFTGQFEFNFLPYITGDKKSISSTYLAGGLGYAQFKTSGSFIIPFGIGAKVNIGERLSTGIELSFRKTFIDKIDENPNPLGNTLLNNNDWYSILGLFISYKFVKFAADCPVYK